MAAAEKHPETVAVVRAWYTIARKTQWKHLADVRATFTSADQVGSVLIFNILGNNYRLICRVCFRTHRLFFKALLTHREYDRKEWKKWA